MSVPPWEREHPQPVEAAAPGSRSGWIFTVPLRNWAKTLQQSKVFGSSKFKKKMQTGVTKQETNMGLTDPSKSNEKEKFKGKFTLRVLD